jgi:Domain of unknown function (DUF4124)
MTNAKLFLLPVAALLVSVLCCASSAHATVYSWRDENGKLHLCNDQEEVPEAHRTTAKTFKSKFAAQTPVAVPVTVPAPSAEPVAISAYERGLERGLQAAERQVALAGELARTLLAAAPQPPPPPPPSPPQVIIIQQPATVVRYVSPEPSPYYAPPFYGFIAPYSTYYGFPYSFTYPYGFGRGRLIPHSHFFPGARRRRAGLYFPYGHASHRGFLFGHGFVVR